MHLSFDNRDNQDEQVQKEKMHGRNLYATSYGRLRVASGCATINAHELV